MNHEPDPWRGLDVWEDFARADAERDARLIVDDEEQIRRAALIAIADREHDRAHDRARQVANANASREYRYGQQARVDHCLDVALLLALMVLAWCGIAALGYCGWLLLAAP